MAKLPNAVSAAIETEKVADYLLSDTHPVGRLKAAFFKRFGFRRDEPEVLKRALQAHAETYEVTKTLTTRYGKKFELSGPRLTPDGRLPIVRTVWIIENGEDCPRFVTALPD